MSLLLAMTPRRRVRSGGIDPIALAIYLKLMASGRYWDLTEASGARAEGVAAVSLSEFNPVSSATGPRGGGDLAAHFDGSAYLRTDVAGATDVLAPPTGGGTHCLWAWLQFDSFVGQQLCIARWDAVSHTSMSYAMAQNSASVAFENGGSDYYFSGAGISSGWHFCVGWRDSADGLLHFCIDDGAVVAGTFVTDPLAQSMRLTVGATDNGAFPMLGSVSRVGWLNGEKLAAEEITWLRNAGQGRNWAEIKALAGY